MGDPLVLSEFDKHVAALVASSTQALPSQLDISVGEDVARLRRDSSIRSALKKCDDAVDKLALMRHVLERAAAEITRQTAAIRSSLAPVMSLPTELLSEIFSFVVHTPEIKKRPLLILHIATVCKRWRYTALSTQNLWILCPTSLSESQQAVWVARSSPGPIDVDIIVYLGTAPPICPELRHQASRWRSITLCHGRGAKLDCLDTIMELPDLRNLQALSLTLADHNPIFNQKRDVRDFKSTFPKLKSVHIRFINISHLHTVAENLTFVSLYGVAYPFSEWWELLSSCPNLEILQLERNELLGFGPETVLETIVLSKLRDLVIGHDDSRVGDVIFNHISAPMLRSFKTHRHCESLDACILMRPFVSNTLSRRNVYMPNHSFHSF